MTKLMFAMILVFFGVVALTTSSWAGNTQQDIASTVIELENIDREIETEQGIFTKLFVLQNDRKEELMHLKKERTFILQYIQRTLDVYTKDCVKQSLDNDTVFRCAERIRNLQQYKQRNDPKLITMLKKGIKMKVQYLKTHKKIMETMDKIQIKSQYQKFLQRKLDILQAK